MSFLGDAGPAFLGSQLLAFERQAAQLLGSEVDLDLAGRRRESILEHPNPLVKVVDLRAIRLLIARATSLFVRQRLDRIQVPMYSPHAFLATADLSAPAGKFRTISAHLCMHSLSGKAQLRPRLLTRLQSRKWHLEEK